MPVLDKLKITENNKLSNATHDGRLRSRLLSGLQDQIAAASAMVKGEPYRKYRDRWVKNEETGEKELKSMPVCFRPWWWKDEMGTVFVGLRYANRWLELTPGKSAIEVGPVEQLETTLKSLLAAVNAGELDATLKKAVEERRAQFESRKPKPQKRKPELVKS